MSEQSGLEIAQQYMKDSMSCITRRMRPLILHWLNNPKALLAFQKQAILQSPDLKNNTILSSCFNLFTLQNWSLNLVLIAYYHVSSGSRLKIPDQRTGLHYHLQPHGGIGSLIKETSELVIAKCMASMTTFHQEKCSKIRQNGTYVQRKHWFISAAIILQLPLAMLNYLNI